MTVNSKQIYTTYNNNKIIRVLTGFDEYDENDFDVSYNDFQENEEISFTYSDEDKLIFVAVEAGDDRVMATSMTVEEFKKIIEVFQEKGII